MLLILVKKDYDKTWVGNNAVVMIPASYAYGLPRRKRRSLEKLDSLRLGNASRFLIENRLLGRILRLTRKWGGLSCQGGHALRSGTNLVVFLNLSNRPIAYSSLVFLIVNRAYPAQSQVSFGHSVPSAFRARPSASTVHSLRKNSYPTLDSSRQKKVQVNTSPVRHSVENSPSAT